MVIIVRVHKTMAVQETETDILTDMGHISKGTGRSEREGKKEEMK